MRTLTPREAEVIQCYADGVGRSQDVADRLGIAYGTVRTHTERAYLTLRAVSKPHAVALALRRGLIT